MAAALLLLVPFPTATAAAGQAAPDRSSEDDAFTELWVHGMAVLGWHGFGSFPLYAPEHARASRRLRSDRGLPPTLLEARRGMLLDALSRDEAFDILQFVPFYSHGSTRKEAMEALAAVASAREQAPELPAHTRLGGSVVAAALPTQGQRRTLGLLVEMLELQWQSS